MSGRSFWASLRSGITGQVNIPSDRLEGDVEEESAGTRFPADGLPARRFYAISVREGPARKEARTQSIGPGCKRVFGSL